jgi:hypothetical protein
VISKNALSFLHFEFWHLTIYFGKDILDMMRSMYEDLSEKFNDFKKIHYEFTELVICTNQGEVLFSTESVKLSDEDCRNILDTWLHHKEELIMREIRYSILKTDIYQYAALNPVLKLGIVGSMDKEYNYAIGFVEAEKNPDNSLLISSIELNKLVWGTKE